MQAQRSTATLTNRYGNIFLTLKQLMKQRYGDGLGGEGCRILSFGCSTGQEVLSLRAYFPHAEILGCDINAEALNASLRALECDPAVIFLSSPEAIKALGPYDIILANSVLCSYPTSKNLNSLSSEFPFAKFVDLAEVLLESLKNDGIFGLVNSNYFFKDLPSAKLFSPVNSPIIEANGFVEKFGTDSRKITNTPIFNSQRNYAHRLLQKDCPYQDDDFRHSLFTRSSKVVLQDSSNVIQPSKMLQSMQLIMGIDPSELKKQDLVGAGLFRGVIETSDGQAFAALEWRRATTTGDIISLGQTYSSTMHQPERDRLLNAFKWREVAPKASKKWMSLLSRRIK